MRKNILAALLLCVLSKSLCAQLLPFNTLDSIDINKINAAVLVHGDLWWNPLTNIEHCDFPNGSQKNINFAGAIWMSGIDGAGKLHVAGQTYRQNGNDYWPGPLDSSDTLTYAISQQWAKIWKVNRTDILYFQGLIGRDTVSTPQSILTWPGAGNTYARGNGNVPLTFYAGNTYAPFIDLNGNGIFEPLLGEYPDVPGDQALWWLFSDNGPAHDASNGRPLGVEVHAMAYGYSRGTLIDNVVYYEYNIINRSPNTYTDFRLAQWADVEIGYYYDDFIGFDSSHRMGITYSGTTCDGCAAGYGSGYHPGFYGYQVPVAGITMVHLPGDVPPAYVPAGSFDYYNNDFSVIGNPVIDSQYYNYMHAELISGEHFTNDFGYPPDSAGPIVNYLFPGDPAHDTQWSECSVYNNPGDRRYVLSSNSFTVLPGSVNKIVLALVTTNLDSNNGCGGVGFSFDSIKIVADTAWAVYNDPPSPLALPISIQSTNTISIYPNPAHDKLYITNTATQQSNTSMTIYNTLGQLMNVVAGTNNSTLDISKLPPGMYYLVYRNGNQQKNIKFIKE